MRSSLRPCEDILACGLGAGLGCGASAPAQIAPAQQGRLGGRNNGIQPAQWATDLASIRPFVEKVTVNLTVFVGSRHEGYGETGMAHLLEHMVFKGTPTIPTSPARCKRSRS